MVVRGVMPSGGVSKLTKKTSKPNTARAPQRRSVLPNKPQTGRTGRKAIRRGSRAAKKITPPSRTESELYKGSKMSAGNPEEPVR
ncbi:unnamed protein product [Allacma fusca]|uniref:Uncharacterized protein n=1 Tax=Allacma fusca TaxID=39272 RepID=A0A8J2K6F8_9HEXA|nr:unnamed protein product [Allacma fusca]